MRQEEKDQFKLSQVNKNTYLFLYLFSMTCRGWGLLETVMVASAPERDIKIILSKTDKDNDDEWYASLLNQKVNVFLSLVT